MKNSKCIKRVKNSKISRKKKIGKQKLKYQSTKSSLSTIEQHEFIYSSESLESFCNKKIFQKINQKDSKKFEKKRSSISKCQKPKKSYQNTKKNNLHSLKKSSEKQIKQIKNVGSVKKLLKNRIKFQSLKRVFKFDIYDSNQKLKFSQCKNEIQTVILDEDLQTDQETLDIAVRRNISELNSALDKFYFENLQKKRKKRNTITNQFLYETQEEFTRKVNSTKNFN